VPQVDTGQLLAIADVAPLPESVGPGDLIIVPGHDLDRYSAPEALKKWLRAAVRSGAEVCAICTGAFVLAEAGLLDQRSCTTHWKRLDQLHRDFPRARVLRDRLFVSDGPITTSAGVASGIDVALSFVERHFGPRLAAALAREMVVYLRRDGHQAQQSVYLDFRHHVNSGVHRVQDYLIGHVRRKARIPELARIARMSPRNLTRAFRAATGISIAEFRSKLRLEVAKTMLESSDASLESLAEQAGFRDPRHFRRAWKRAFGIAPSRSKAALAAMNR
jgi:transcriptional regulator GlxA family with amidase domain